MEKLTEKYNCLSFAAFQMGWSKEEQTGLAIEKPFYKNLTLEKFLLLYAKHIGRSYYAEKELAEESNLVTFSNMLSGHSIEHIAVLDPNHELMILERHSWDSESVPVSLNDLRLNEDIVIDYWNVPRNEHFEGLLDNNV